ncbi:MAG TPA: hypothetical protein VFG18_06550 [Xanthomonadaceae bacterium]|jgi:Flp pilus assembly protein TadB|nr:hypothetical protein [Xanthomonadaceae bacterium]
MHEQDPHDLDERGDARRLAATGLSFLGCGLAFLVVGGVIHLPAMAAVGVALMVLGSAFLVRARNAGNGRAGSHD